MYQSKWPKTQLPYPFCEWKQYETDGFPHEDHTFRAIKRWTQHYWHNLYLVYNFQGPWSVVIFTLPDICLSIPFQIFVCPSICQFIHHYSSIAYFSPLGQILMIFHPGSILYIMGMQWPWTKLLISRLKVQQTLSLKLCKILFSW